MTITGLPHAHGHIQVCATQVPVLESALSRLESRADAFLVPFTGSSLPSACIDGRPDGLPDGRVRLAGGSLTPWVATLLAHGDDPSPLPRSGDEAVAALAQFCHALHDEHLPIATHSDDHAPEGRCGCGAADSLGAVVEILATEADVVADIIAQWGFASDVTAFVPRAQALAPVLANHGLEFFQTLAADSDDTPVRVVGSHDEVAVVANCRPHTVVDRVAIEHFFREEGFEGAQVFVVDVWACREEALELHQSPAHASAAAAFNAAALLTLCGEQMRMVTLV